MVGDLLRRASAPAGDLLSQVERSLESALAVLARPEDGGPEHKARHLAEATRGEMRQNQESVGSWFVALVIGERHAGFRYA